MKMKRNYLKLHNAIGKKFRTTMIFDSTLIKGNSDIYQELGQQYLSSILLNLELV